MPQPVRFTIVITLLIAPQLSTERLGVPFPFFLALAGIGTLYSLYAMRGMSYPSPTNPPPQNKWGLGGVIFTVGSVTYFISFLLSLILNAFLPGGNPRYSISDGLTRIVSLSAISVPFFVIFRRKGLLTDEAVHSLNVAATLSIVWIAVTTILFDRGERIHYGIFNHPNGLGATVIILSVMVCATYRKTPRILRITSVAAVALSYLTLWLTSSRATLLTLLVFVGVWAFLSTRRKHRMVVVFAGTVLGISIGLTRMPQVRRAWDSVRGMNSDELQTISMLIFNKNLDTGRFGLWSRLIATWKERPMLGYGPGGSFPNYNPERLSAHNQYLSVLFDQGIVGLIGFITALLGLAILLGGTGNRSGRIGIAYLISLSVHALFEVSILANQIGVSLLFWTTVAVLMQLSKIPSSPPAWPSFRGVPGESHNISTV